MSAKKSTKAKSSTTTVRAKGASKSRAAAKPHSASDVMARLPKPIKDAIAEARETSREYALASLGLVSQIRKQRETRMAEMVAEGKRVEPKIKQAVEKWTETLKSKLDVKNLELPKLNAAEVRERLEEFLAASRRRFDVSAR